jgi:hypothetical protein
MTLRFTNSYLADSLAVFRYYKVLAEKAMAQVTDSDLLTPGRGGELHRHPRKAHGREHALALD